VTFSVVFADNAATQSILTCYLPGGPGALATHLARLAAADVHRTILQFVRGD
jgi:hypothetical protein